MVFTWNPSDKSSSVTLSGGDLTASVSGLGADVVASVRTTSPVTGKIYFELDIRTSLVSFVALATSAAPLDAAGYGANQPGLNDESVAAFLVDGNIYQNFSVIGSGPYDYNANGAYACFAIDVTNKKFWGRTTVAATNWNQSATADPATGVGGADFSGIAAGDLYILIGLQGSQIVVANFGASAFNQTPPSGYTGPDAGGGSYTLAGSAAGVGAATGSMGANRPIAGTSTGAGAAAGAAGATRPLAGSSGGVGSAAGALGVQRPLAGSASGVGSASATLGAGPGALAGAASGLGAAVAAMVRLAPLAGQATGLGSATMNMQGGAFWSPAAPAAADWTPAAAAGGSWTPEAATPATWS